MNNNLIALLNLHRQWWKDPIYLGVVVTAVAIHAFVLSIHFAMPSASDASNKDTTISIQLSPSKVKEADFLAQDDQQGDGETEQALRKSAITPPMPDTKMGDEEKESSEQLHQLQQKQELNFEEKVLMTVLSWQKQAEQNQRKKQQEALERQVQANTAMIASVEAQYLQRQQDLTRQQSIKTVSAVQAKKDVSAPYLERFRQKVESYGNQYYPEQAKLEGLAGEVRLMVILNQQGGLRDIRMMQSSGSEILDRAAIDSVKKSAPFGVFSEAMRQDISELRIIRTWRFDPAGAEISVNATE